ncbi:uncharacterized protein, partial [Venturia canescens]|uniref:uncharacterized protein n=1 Tax=Venturia canescens TaxID=32260 RepID=UPI001C9C21AF
MSGRSSRSRSADGENVLEKRIRKLEELIEKKFKKKRKRRRHASSSSEERSKKRGRDVRRGSRYSSSENVEGDDSVNIGLDVEVTESEPVQVTQFASQEPTRVPADDIVGPRQVLPAVNSNGDSAASESVKEATLDPQILEVLGKRILEERVLDEEIPPEMAVRWEEILKRGLPAEDRDNIIKKYPPPKNAGCIDPPVINPEVKAVLPETVVKRDERIAAKQVKLAACIAAVGKMFLGVLNDSQERLSLLGRLSDTGRLLADLLHDESAVRRSLVLANIGSSFKEVLSSSTADDFLFGRQLDEKVKAAKVLENTSRELGTSRADSSVKGPKNLKFPPRRFSRDYRQRSTG